MGTTTQNNLNSSNSARGFVTRDPQVLDLLQMIAKIAPTEVPVLIQGESGTGKELIARKIHEESRRANEPIVSINCGAIQETLLSSELFGHEKGAFTGAVTQKKGLAEIADGGTLFLDEIGEMGFDIQAKLLRFLQNGEIYRVGGKAPIKVNVRIVSATNKQLENQVKQGKFREDLFYRINTVTLTVPPLRKRPDDVPLLVQRFLEEDTGTEATIRQVSAKAMEMLKRYGWPGNVRELQNTVERFKILVESETLSEDDLPQSIRNPVANSDWQTEPTTFLLDQVEKRHILRVLAHFKGNKTKAAQAMGITVKTLYNKLAQYETQPPDDPTTH
jgi:transcriptional regulator with PAS, ATPase and Fis domain